VTEQGPAPAQLPDADAPSTLVPPRSTLSRVVQIVGFIISLGLLGYCIQVVRSDEKLRASFERLAQVPWWQVAMLVLVSAATIALAGLVFRSVLRPVRRLSIIECIAVNGVCSALSYLPFKASLIFRVLHHRTRDGVPLLTIGAWMAATAGLILVSLAPPVVASLWRGTMDTLWWLTTIGGTIVLAALACGMARLFSGDAGLAMLLRWSDATRLPFAGRFVRSQAFLRLHSATRMAGDPGVVARVIALRSIDLALAATRFYFAAKFAGVELSVEQSVLAGATYFFIQGAAPTGVAGVREAGSSFVLGEEMLPAILIVSAVDAVANLSMGLLGAARLGIMSPRTAEAQGPTALDQGTSADAGGKTAR
jgi:hypothetical protein